MSTVVNWKDCRDHDYARNRITVLNVAYTRDTFAEVNSSPELIRNRLASYGFLFREELRHDPDTGREIRILFLSDDPDYLDLIAEKRREATR